MIEVRELTKRYGSELAVDRISFSVRAGEVVGFLGPNGAGKTTTMKVITCYLPPTEGTVFVDGLDVRRDSLAIRRKIGYLPENTPLYPDMVTYDYLEFVAAMRGLEGAARRRRLAEVVEVCGLGEVLHKRIETLSKGYRQRVGLAQAMVHDPPILILDEPTSGLDPNQIVEIRTLIKTLGREKTVILSTHILPEVQASCDRVLIIHRGRIVADGTPDALQLAHGGQRLLFGVFAPEPEVRAALERIDGVRVEEVRSESDGSLLLRLGTEGQRDLRPELFQLAVDRGWKLTELHRERVDLEEVFRQLTMN
ncbi:ATP-binding cassette domain-containing protein [Rhodothermus bifroesti]|uniref:ATP-binding cassette domain-containing protein n=1 Tax=Rhodothermus marinus TaxID=29549 RepID=A0A7V2F5I3_RHOMR|nr:ATP-binding cassette domain-containing protein [Rhodothermus bifroesti]